MDPRREPSEKPVSRPLPAAPVAPRRIVGSESIAAITAAMRDARKSYDPIRKDHENPFHKSRYATLSGVLAAVDEALGKNGLLVLQSTRWEAGELWLDTTIEHVSGEWVASVYPLFASNYCDPQRVGASLTYARRYVVQMMLGIAPEDDDGETAIGRGQGRQRYQQGQGRRDDRSRYQEDDRRAVNRAFQEQATTGERPPASAGQRESWGDFITSALRAENDAWRNEMIMEGVPPELRREHEELANAHQMVNHICTRLIEKGRLESADVGKDGKPTVRDSRKALGAVIDAFGRYPRGVRAAVHAHLAEKRREKRIACGMRNLDDAEPVAAQGREPGEDG